jgi:hypothetical protein
MPAVVSSMVPFVSGVNCVFETSTGPVVHADVPARRGRQAVLEPLGVRDVFGQSTTTASQVRYVNEGTALSGAAGVAEAGTKPE